jgi:hypothetical protein
VDGASGVRLDTHARPRDRARAWPRTARSLTMAALAMPDVLTASEGLVATFRAGRFAAYGRLIARQVTTTGEAPERILGDGREKISQEFWTDGGDLSDDLELGVMARAPAGDAARWVDLDVEANACIGHWQPPAAILGEGALSIGQFAAQLEPEPIDRLRWLLTHPAVIVTGLNDRAECVTIPAAALAFGKADIEADTLTTRDGRLIWSTVMVDLALAITAEPAPVEPAPAPAAPRRRVGNVAYDDAGLVARAVAAIVDKEQKSPLAAALAIAGRDGKGIPGHGSPESKARRLADKVRKARPDLLK